MVGLVFLVAGGFLVLLVYVSFSGPSDVSRVKSWEIDEAALVEWMAGSAEEEAVFRREFERDPQNPEVFSYLEKAIGFQRQLRAKDPEDAFGSVTRLEMLLDLLEETKGKIYRSTVMTNGKQAADLVADGDSLTAIPLLEEALAKQEWINTHLRESSYVDVGEVTRLKQWLANLQTQDAVAEVERLYEEARNSYESRDWDLAESLFDRALRIQESINQNMPESPHVRWRLIQEFKDYKQRIEAGRLDQRINELLSSNASADQAERLRIAVNLQGVLNQKYNNTEFANEERYLSLRDSLQSDQSQASSTLLQQQVEALESHLRQRAWESAHGTLLELEASVDAFVAEFSSALLPVPDLEARVGWLVTHRDNWREITSMVDAAMLPHPQLDLRVHKTEVDQLLYTAVMGTNPSRWKGDGLPVDSVGFFEAREFCQRLGWVLGEKVVLPRIDWLSFLEDVDLEETSLWYSDNSGFRSNPVGESKPSYGLYDLFGNLEEWVLESDGQTALGLFGGCGADSSSKVMNDPLNKVSANFRSRWTGFRFCILDNQ